MLGYSLQPVILPCQLQNLPQINGPAHSWFHLNSPWRYSLTAHWCTIPWFTSLIRVWRSSGNGLAQGPHYDRFSQDSNPWSSDHWLSALKAQSKLQLTKGEFINVNNIDQVIKLSLPNHTRMLSMAFSTLQKARQCVQVYEYLKKNHVIFYGQLIGFL